MNLNVKLCAECRLHRLPAEEHCLLDSNIVLTINSIEGILEWIELSTSSRTWEEGSNTRTFTHIFDPQKKILPSSLILFHFSNRRYPYFSFQTEDQKWIFRHELCKICSKMINSKWALQSNEDEPQWFNKILSILLNFPTFVWRHL